MKLTPWMKALVWLGLGGGIGFFAGFRIGYSKDKKIMDKTYGEIVCDAEAKVRKEYEAEIGKANAEIQAIKHAAQEALKAQREYFGAKDDEIISEGQMEMGLDAGPFPDEDVDIMDEVPEMPEDPFPEEDDGDNDGDEEIQQLHPEDLRPYEIEEDEYDENPKGYDRIELDYYTEDCVIFDPDREEKWTHPEQLLGIGWKERFYAGHLLPVREIYVRNDTMEILYKITRIDDSFERLYEEE